MTYEKIKCVLLGTVVSVSLTSCVSIPPQVANLHLKEQEIINNLRGSHLELADAYMEKKLEEEENSFFYKRGPMYRKEWLKNFKKQKGRPYDPEKDFGLFYNDLVGHYQKFVAIPNAAERTKLQHKIAAEYRNVLDAHQALREWLDALKKLSDAQRQAANEILNSTRPGLSLNNLNSTNGDE